MVETSPEDDGGQNPFRRYALALYGAPGVEPVCLAFQDDLALDVNMVLLCCWVGRFGVRLPEDTLRRADQVVRPWRETVIEPLRGLRRRMKTDIGGIGPDRADPARQTVKRAELQAEFTLQDHLLTVLDHLPGGDGRAADRAGIIRGNLIRYAGLSGVAPAQLREAGAETLIAAAVETYSSLPSEVEAEEDAATVSDESES
jgi:uncharacterized protein (TIGR02444 family)